MAWLKAEERRAEVGVGPEKKSPGKSAGSMGPLRRGEKELHLHGSVPSYGGAPLQPSSPSAPWRPAEKGRKYEVRRRGWGKKEGREQPVQDLATSSLAVAGCGGSRRSFGVAGERGGVTGEREGFFLRERVGFSMSGAR